ncbi:MAG: hypothetical protein ACJASL_005027, partial [Paraglaciecola sp.]
RGIVCVILFDFYCKGRIVFLKEQHRANCYARFCMKFYSQSRLDILRLAAQRPKAQSLHRA